MINTCTRSTSNSFCVMKSLKFVRRSSYFEAVCGALESAAYSKRQQHKDNSMRVDCKYSNKAMKVNASDIIAALYRQQNKNNICSKNTHIIIIHVEFKSIGQYQKKNSLN